MTTVVATPGTSHFLTNCHYLCDVGFINVGWCLAIYENPLDIPRAKMTMNAVLLSTLLIWPPLNAAPAGQVARQSVEKDGNII